MHTLIPRASCAALFLTLAVTGCSSSSSGPPIPTFSGEGIPISGVVKLDGEPLADANITFIRESTGKEGVMSGSGKTDMSGKYAVRTGGQPGVPPGRYRVVVSKLATKDGSPFVPNPEQGLDLEQARLNGMVREAVPAKFSDVGRSTLSVEVTSGQDPKQDFDLKTK